MISFPNAKINLGLNVTGKRPDKFHEVETVIFPIAFCDILEIIPSGKRQFDFQYSGLTIPGRPEDNLCIRAYRMLKDEFNLPDVRIHLHKVIPMGAGLGGGSSDAACTIKLLNDLFSIALSPFQMIQYANRLGSDCPFFIENRPCFASGKGNQLEPVDLELAGYSVAIVVPPVHVSTAEAYEQVEIKKPAENIRAILMTPPDLWKDHLINDFEGSVFKSYAEILQIKETLYRAGAVYASLSGSGSSVYGLFDRPVPDLTLFTDCITWTGNLF
jgi:4-diphosphocytidyl-2-C-methyl-D-erythritol kinase